MAEDLEPYQIELPPEDIDDLDTTFDGLMHPKEPPANLPRYVLQYSRKPSAPNSSNGSNGSNGDGHGSDDDLNSSGGKQQQRKRRGRKGSSGSNTNTRSKNLNSKTRSRSRSRSRSYSPSPQHSQQRRKEEREKEKEKENEQEEKADSYGPAMKKGDRRKQRHKPYEEEGRKKKRGAGGRWKEVEELKPDLPPTQLARQFAAILQEKNLEMLEVIIETVGGETAIQVLRKTEQVIINGGIDLPTAKKEAGRPVGRQKRTPGGVFIHCVREDLGNDRWKTINDTLKARRIAAGKTTSGAPRKDKDKEKPNSNSNQATKDAVVDTAQEEGSVWKAIMGDPFE